MKKLNPNTISERLDKNLGEDITETYQDFLEDIMTRFSSSNHSLAKFDLKTKSSAENALLEIQKKLDELESFKKEAKSLRALMEQKRWELENK